MGEQHTPPPVPIVSLLDAMPSDGTAVVVGDESGTGSLWIDWAHHGEVNVPACDLANGMWHG